MINAVAIRLKSKELNIPFEHLLAGYVLEEVVQAIYSSPWSGKLYVRNDHQLGLSYYEKKVAEKLELSYHTEADNNEIQEYLLEEFVEGWKQTLQEKGVIISRYEILLEKKDRDTVGHIRLFITYEDMYIPMDLYIYPQRKKAGFARNEELRLVMENQKVIPYQRDSLEYMAANDMFHILKDLELLNDMEYYLHLYELIAGYSLEGRRVKDEYEKLWEQNKLPSIEKRLDMIREYGTYTYMKKKWKVLLRKEKRNSPQWEDVVALIIKFLDPMYESIIKQEIFFGDWMPELQRYLE